MQLSLHRGMSDVLLFSRAGFNVETVEYKNISFTVWDVGGQDKVNDLSPFSRHPSCSAA
jgi:GTPase SAR1 family protein